MKITFTIFLFFVSHLLVATETDTINRVDSLGKRQGYWKITAAMKNQQAYYPSPDALIEEGGYLNSMKTGTWIQYWPSGNMKSRMQYANNRPNGATTFYFENGHVNETGTWRGTRWIGEYRSYHTNDTLKWLFNYNPMGMRSGMQYYYWPNGKLQMSVNYVNGKEDGWRREYNDGGTLVREMYFSIYPDSCKTINYPSNKPPYIDDYGDGDPTGPGGKEEEKENYSDPGMKWRCPPDCECEGNKIINGQVHRYDTNGLLIRIEIYKNGKYVGDAPIDE